MKPEHKTRLFMGETTSVQIPPVRKDTDPLQVNTDRLLTSPKMKLLIILMVKDTENPVKMVPRKGHFLLFFRHPLWPNNIVVAPDGQAERNGATFAS